MNLTKLKTGALGFDTFSKLDDYQPESARTLVDAIITATLDSDRQIQFAIRYLENLTKTELEYIVGIGQLAVAFVNVAGDFDGPKTTERLSALGIPKGATVFADLESGAFRPEERNPFSLIRDVFAKDISARINSWAAEVQAAEYVAGLYVGDGALLTSEELFSLRVTVYWHAASLVVDRHGNEAGPKCGWQLHQLSSPNQVVGGVQIDFDVLESDHFGRNMLFVTA